MAQSLPHAFKCAAEGVAFAFKQRNMRIDSGFAVAAVVLGFALRIDAPSWLAIVICIGAVMAAETANTAIEAVVDLVSPEYHVLAKHAKDCAAGSSSHPRCGVGCRRRYRFHPQDRRIAVLGMQKEGFKSGFATLVGRPNAGKSTL